MKLSKDDLLLYAITDRRNLDKKVFFETSKSSEFTATV